MSFSSHAVATPPPFLRGAGFGAWFGFLVVFLGVLQHTWAGIVDSSSLSWRTLPFPSSTPDVSTDQQTGQQEGDIVGDASNAAVFTTFDNAGTPSLLDGVLFFRVRLGGEESPPGYSRAFFVGMEANGDGALDGFIGVDNSGASDTIGIWDAGAGANVSPSTTTIASSPYLSYTQTAANYNWRAVNLGTDGGTSANLDGGTSGTDYYLSYAVPFSDVISYFSTVKSLSVDENSSFRFVFATATQANSLNQDLGGVTGSVNSAQTWSSLGVISDPVAVPEPGSALLLLLACLFRGRHRAEAASGA